MALSPTTPSVILAGDQASLFPTIGQSLLPRPAKAKIQAEGPFTAWNPPRATRPPQRVPHEEPAEANEYPVKRVMNPWNCSKSGDGQRRDSPGRQVLGADHTYSEKR